MASDQEIKKSYKISVEGDIIYMVFLDFSTEYTHMAEEMTREMSGILHAKPKADFKLLVDLTRILDQILFNTNMSGRKVFSSLAQEKQIKKVAIIGYNVVAKVLVNFVIAAGIKLGMTQWTNKDMIQWFKDKTTALAWLKAE